MKKTKLFLAETGDAAVNILIAAFSQEEAIKLANSHYQSQELDDGSGFVFTSEDVEEVEVPDHECVIDVFVNNF